MIPENQSDDLTNAKAELIKAIDEINLTSQQQFQVTFEQIKKNFEYTFQTLFGGVARSSNSSRRKTFWKRHRDCGAAARDETEGDHAAVRRTKNADRGRAALRALHGEALAFCLLERTRCAARRIEHWIAHGIVRKIVAKSQFDSSERRIEFVEQTERRGLHHVEREEQRDRGHVFCPPDSSVIPFSFVPGGCATISMPLFQNVFRATSSSCARPPPNRV